MSRMKSEKYSNGDGSAQKRKWKLFLQNHATWGMDTQEQGASFPLGLTLIHARSRWIHCDLDGAL